MTKEKITKLQIKYPKNQEPNYIEPSDYQPFCFILGRKGNDERLHQENMKKIAELISEFSIKQVWGAWGNLSHKNLLKAKTDLITLLR